MDHPEQLEHPKVALVDADFLVYKVSFGDIEATESAAKNRLTEYLTDIVYMNLEADDYKAWITGKGNYRYDVARTAPYKGNRKDTEKPPHYQALRDHLERLGAKVTFNNEADDAVAIESCRGNYWIVHVDKDLDQLTGWHYNPVKNERYYVDELQGLFNFYTQILVGDRVDNILGLRGIGPVKAAKILKDCTNEDELYEACCKAYRDHEETQDRLIENGQLLWLQRKENQLWQPPSKDVSVSP